MFRNLFRRRDHRPRDLYAAVVDQARQPAFYAMLGVPDTLDGRFDMIVLHLSTVIDRLRNPDRSIDPHGQNLFDLFLTDMDHNLRQMGVGDLSVPKRMKKIGQSFYGRFGAYTHAEGEAPLAAAIGRNVFAEDGPPRPAARVLAHYYIDTCRGLSSQTVDDILAGAVRWPAIPALGEATLADPSAHADTPPPIEGEGVRPLAASDHENLSDPSPAARA